MRTKTLLMSAAALLAAGIVSSQAQTPVYSQNVVGYASVATPGNGSVNYLITVPFAIGVSNGANEVFPVVSGVPTLPDGSSILIWSFTTASYSTYYADSAGSSSGWDDINGPIPNAPLLPVGMGFFLNPVSPVTNVFAGTVAVNVGTSNAMFLNGNGSVNFLVSCVVPYAGAVTNGNATTYAGGPNLSINGGLPDGSALLIWNFATSSYTTYYSDSGSTSLWDDINGPIALPPSITVGQGFFLSPVSPFNWKVGL